MKITNVPRTLAIIPDGNRRWSRSHKLSILSGYSQGVSKFIEFSEWCAGYGINSISVWALSTENFKRNSKEVDALFRIYKRVALDRNVIDRLHSNKTRLNIVGNKKLLPKDLRDSLHRVELETKKYSDKVINMLIGYGGRDDLMSAARSIAKKFPKGNVTEEEFGNFLISRSIPEIDFVIRTSGEKRLSGFMPWQAGYAELYFSKKLWPDFTRNDLHAALVDYSNRQRRFGR